MPIQLIRLSQIKANLPGFVDFEQQLISMFGSEDVFKFIAVEGQKTFILPRDYKIGKNSLRVFLNGILQLQSSTDGYIEINSKMIAFSEGLQGGDVVSIIYNNNKRYSNLMGQNRVKAYEIHRESIEITDANKDILTFTAPAAFSIGLNQLRVYVNGLLKTPVMEYTENGNNTFTLLTNLKVKDHLTMEVISGGLQVYKTERFAVKIDAANTNQRLFVIPASYTMMSNTLRVYLNGVLLRRDVDYQETSETSITLLRGLAENYIVEIELTTFSVDVFTISRDQRIYTDVNKANTEISTIVPYAMGETTLRVYLNGALLREGADNDYVEVNENKFKLNYPEIPAGNVVFYEIISW